MSDLIDSKEPVFPHFKLAESDGRTFEKDIAIYNNFHDNETYEETSTVHSKNHLNLLLLRSYDYTTETR